LIPPKIGGGSSGAAGRRSFGAGGSDHEKRLMVLSRLLDELDAATIRWNLKIQGMGRQHFGRIAVSNCRII
jgi:hypothetical protein